MCKPRHVATCSRRQKKSSCQLSRLVVGEVDARIVKRSSRHGKRLTCKPNEAFREDVGLR